MLGKENVQSQPATESRRRLANHFSGWRPAENCTKEGLGGSTPLGRPADSVAAPEGTDQSVLRWRWQVAGERGDAMVEPIALPRGLHGEVVQRPLLSFSPCSPSTGT